MPTRSAPRAPIAAVDQAIAYLARFDSNLVRDPGSAPQSVCDGPRARTARCAATPRPGGGLAEFASGPHDPPYLAVVIGHVSHNETSVTSAAPRAGISHRAWLSLTGLITAEGPRAACDAAIERRNLRGDCGVCA